MTMGFAAQTATESLDWVDLSMGLAGGLALFLIGMGQITVSLKAVAGDRLRAVLARLSSNRVIGAITGSFTTAIIQSSSVTTVLTVGFVSASLLSVTQAASVIVGANLGTTVTAQVIALDVTDYALGMLAVGAATAAAAGRRRQTLSEVGTAIAGLGFVFLGLDVMSDAMAPLGTYQPFLDLIADSSSPFVGLLLGAAFTGLIQSSSATTGIVVVMGASGLLDLETGIAIILGANIGTAVTAVLAAIGKSRGAWRAALVHVLVNVVGAAVWIGFIGTLADIANWVGGHTSDGPASPQQFANAHTVFNAINTVAFLVLLTPLVALTDRLVPTSVGTRPIAAARPAFLDRDVLNTPVLALEMTRRELLRLGLRVRSMLVASVPAAMSGTRRDLSDVAESDEEVDALHAEIVAYLGELSRKDLGGRQRDELLRLLRVNNELEQMADMIVNGLVSPGIRRIDEVVDVSSATRTRMVGIQDIVLGTLDDALEALGTGDADAAARVADSKADFHDLEGAANEHLANRLIAPDPQRIEAYSIEVSMIDGLRRVHQSCRRIARAARAVLTTPRAE
jgi:phosphate:Na+ symporter